MHERKTTTFQELIAAGVLEIGDGYRAKLEELGGSGPIFLRAGLLSGRGIDWAGAEKFHEDLARQVSSKLGQPGDTVVTTKGNSIGRTGYIHADAPSFVYSPHLSYWRSLDSSQLAPGFLRYWSLGAEFADQLHAMATSTDMAPYLSLVDQRRLRISIPHIGMQKCAASVLEALDDKITANDRIVNSCDELRGLQLTNWLGANHEQTEVRPLSSVADFVNGKAFTKGATGMGRMVIRIAEINSGPAASTIYNDIKVPDMHLARPGDVLFSWSGSLAVARWFRPEAIINQHIFKVIPRGAVPAWLAFELVRDKLTQFKSIASDKATTMGHIQRRHLDEPVTVPASDYLTKLDAELGPLWRRALLAEQESLTLVELRDALLPKLMSGEVGVREAVKTAEGLT
jgi:type I restriction enzyme, S subunit